MRASEKESAGIRKTVINLVSVKGDFSLSRVDVSVLSTGAQASVSLTAAVIKVEMSRAWKLPGSRKNSSRIRE